MSHSPLRTLPFSWMFLLLGACGANAGGDSGSGLEVDEKAFGGVAEACDGIDNNANGTVDEDCGACDFLVSRGKTFWATNACVIDGDATGYPLLPITVGVTTFRSSLEVETFLLRASDASPKFALAQELTVAKLNVAAFHTGSVQYIDYDADGVVDTVSALIARGEWALGTNALARFRAFGALLATMNAAGAAVPLYFDASCIDAPEVCDGVDNDGDGVVDESCGCIEVCDGVDNDADGTVDVGTVDGASTSWYPDADGDGEGAASGAVVACFAPVGYVATATDCDDTSGAVNRGATEACNGIDDNCSGTIDEGLLVLWYRDADADGRGSTTDSLAACTVPSGYVPTGADCDDGNAAVYLGAAETCNGIDDNCNGLVDEVGMVLYYLDADGDGWGSTSATILACTLPFGYASRPGDCNDASAAILPAATEVCNGVDDNCDGNTDEGVTTGYLHDADGDGFGFPSPTDYVKACTAPAGYVADHTDCDDANAGIHPGVVEIPLDGVDQNCDGSDVT